MAMTAAGMKAKIKAAYEARTGQQMQEGTFNALIDLCTGIIEEIQANAEVSGTVVSGAGAPGNVEGTIS